MSPPTAFPASAREVRRFGAILQGGDVQFVDRQDEERFRDFAKHHRLAPYVAHLLQGREGAPSWLRQETVQAVAQDLRRMSWIEDLFRRLEREAILPVLFKGLGVALTYYPRSYLRPIGDLDIYVRRSQLEATIAVAGSFGFQLQDADPAVAAWHSDVSYAVPLVHAEHGLLEIHHHVYEDCVGEIEQSLDTNLVQVGALPAKMIQSAPCFVLLARHWAVSVPGKCWGWSLDLWLLANSLTSDDWRRVHELTRESGLQLYVAAALQTLERAWGAPPAAVGLLSLLRGELRPFEAAALEALDGFCERQPTFPSDVLWTARRVSGRPTRGPWRRVLVSHPGTVCVDLGIGSQSPWFWAQRVRHAWLRGRRGLRTVSAILRAAAPHFQRELLGLPKARGGTRK